MKLRYHRARKSMHYVSENINPESFKEKVDFLLNSITCQQFIKNPTVFH